MKTPRGAHVSHANPGAPIELVLWGDGRVDQVLRLSDMHALFLAHQLLQAVVGNEQAKARGK